MIGAIVIRSAGRPWALRTSTLSPRLTPTFRRTRPSIRMIPLPSSSCMTRNSFAAVDFLPRIWMISPTSTPSATRVFVSTRARPSPTSDWGASATLRIIRSGTTVRTPRAYIKVMARILRRANRPSQRWFSAALHAPFLDLARLVDNEVLRDDEVHATMRADADVLTFDIVRSRTLQIKVLTFDRIRRELYAADIPVEVARTRVPRGLALEVPAHMIAARGSELDGHDRNPRDHAVSHEPDRFTANLRAKARKVNGTHRLARDAHRVLRST